MRRNGRIRIQANVGRKPRGGNLTEFLCFWRDDNGLLRQRVRGEGKYDSSKMKRPTGHTAGRSRWLENTWLI
jgi:hypothetical protein